jgi:hypothetical protein
MKTMTAAVLGILLAMCGCGGGSFESGSPTPGPLGMTAPAVGDAGAGDAAPVVAEDAGVVLPWSVDRDAGPKADFDALPPGCADQPGYTPGTVASCDAGVLPAGCYLWNRCADGLKCGDPSYPDGCVYGIARGEPCADPAHFANSGCAQGLKCGSWTAADTIPHFECIPNSWVCTHWLDTEGAITYPRSLCSESE